MIFKQSNILIELPAPRLMRERLWPEVPKDCAPGCQAGCRLPTQTIYSNKYEQTFSKTLATEF